MGSSPGQTLSLHNGELVSQPHPEAPRAYLSYVCVFAVVFLTSDGVSDCQPQWQIEARRFVL